MSKEQDFSAAHEATIRKWTRDRDRAQDSAEHAEKSTRKAIASLLKNESTRQSTAKDLKNAMDNEFDSKKYQNDGGYRNDELITGFEDKPWEKD